MAKRHPRYVCVMCDKKKDPHDIVFFKGKTCFGVCYKCEPLIKGNVFEYVNSKLPAMKRKYPNYAVPYMERLKGLNK